MRSCVGAAEQKRTFLLLKRGRFFWCPWLQQKNLIGHKLWNVSNLATPILIILHRTESGHFHSHFCGLYWMDWFVNGENKFSFTNQNWAFVNNKISSILIGDAKFVFTKLISSKCLEEISRSTANQEWTGLYVQIGLLKDFSNAV